ncbi:MAG: UDP-N-acetylmuramoyl-tripeptide--D-alanyl-D-alanine ligase, partial [Candidatus Omnitrophica bacterium]|nr:UDP-N-acetylmuramoyl-tripeptide--D-alanyl-D-alanine ligase [Candidatus Omnitrophota bacterium]
MLVKINIEQICRIVQGRRIDALNVDPRIRGVSIDTRTIKKGDLYVAIVGHRHDGHAFIKKAVSHGAVAVIQQTPCRERIIVPQIEVKDTTIALGLLAKYIRSKFQGTVVAVTGSVGKTTTKEYIAAVLNKKAPTLKNIHSFNNHIGVPLTLFNLKQKHQFCVLEVGTNQKGDIAYLGNIIKPQVGVFTNIGDSHLEKLKNRVGVWKEKSSLVKYLSEKGWIIYNREDAYLVNFDRKSFKDKFHVKSFGRGPLSDFRISDVQIKPTQTS